MRAFYRELKFVLICFSQVSGNVNSVGNSHYESTHLQISCESISCWLMFVKVYLCLHVGPDGSKTGFRAPTNRRFVCVHDGLRDHGRIALHTAPQLDWHSQAQHLDLRSIRSHYVDTRLLVLISPRPRILPCARSLRRLLVCHISHHALHVCP